MSFISRLFFKQKEEDYETVLSTLANNIKKRQVQLSEIRLRERRATLLVTLYTLAAWVAYVSLWYTNLLPNIRGRGAKNSVGKFLGALPVLLGPIVILFIRRIVQIWYKRKGDAEDRTLQQLLKQQRDKVEEIKKKTNYYSTRELLQRYDEGSPAGSPLQPKAGPRPSQSPAVPVTPQRQPMPQNNGSAMRTPVTPALLQQLSGVSPTPPEPPRKQWLDKIVDVVLGDDDSARFALICEKCFSHNGLVKESVWEDTRTCTDESRNISCLITDSLSHRIRLP
jgi:endoplasmic reticulum junction formation protein lunapark